MKTSLKFQHETKLPDPPEDYQPSAVIYKIGDMVAFHEGTGTFIENDSFVGTIVAIESKPRLQGNYEWYYVIRYSETSFSIDTGFGVSEQVVAVLDDNIFQKLT